MLHVAMWTPLSLSVYSCDLSTIITIGLPAIKPVSSFLPPTPFGVPINYHFIAVPLPKPADESDAYYADDDMSCALDAFFKLSKIGTEEQVYQWKTELVKLNPNDYTNCDEIKSWSDTIYNQWLRTRRDEPCVEEYFNILGKADKLPLHGITSANMCPFCAR